MSLNESNSQQLAEIGEKKIFHELDVHHVQEVGIKRFWAVEAKIESDSHIALSNRREENFS